MLVAALTASDSVAAKEESGVQSMLNEESPDVFLAKATLQVGEDTYRSEEQGMSVDDPSVYLLFKSRGGFMVGDKKADMQLAELRDGSVRIGYPAYVDGQAQARRESAMHGGKHR
jgi:hypothetical protein